MKLLRILIINKIIAIELFTLNLMIGSMFIMIMIDQIKDYFKHKKFLKGHENYKRRNKK